MINFIDMTVIVKHL